MIVFFFQAEDGIRDGTVTGVQTCALPICFAQLRVDDPNQQSPPGQGSNVFIDRGAIERADFTGPRAVLYSPLDNDADRKSTRLNSSHSSISYAVFCLKKKK